MHCFVGIDIGTSGVKSLIVDDVGRILSEATKPYSLSCPAVNFFEQDPEEWWGQACMAVKEMFSNGAIHPADIMGIGLSGQYHGLVAVDERGDVVRPAILWNDQRTGPQSEEIVRRVGQERLLSIAGTRGALYFTACKLLWVREHEPEKYRRIKKIMLPKDFIRFRMTGLVATDVSDASGTMLLDLGKRDWSQEICGALDIDPGLLPKVYESCQITGRLSDVAAARLGLLEGIPVVAGGGDQACAAIGNGIVGEGDVTYSIGTSGVIYCATDSIRVDPEGRVNTFCHAVPGTWALLACINSAAASLNWFVENLCRFEQAEAKKLGVSVYRIIDDAAAAMPEGSDNLIFVPYLAGERHPHTDPLARGVFFGLHSGHTIGHMGRAVMEGVAYSFRDCLEVFRALGVRIDNIKATGGGTRSDLWMKIMANVSGSPLILPGKNEGGAALGAAILAAVGSGEYASVPEACMKMTSFQGRVDTDEKLVERYSRYVSLYRTLYARFQASYWELADI